MTTVHNIAFQHPVALILLQLRTSSGYLLPTTELNSKVKVMLRPTVSRAVCFGTKHPFGAYDQILITVRPDLDYCLTFAGLLIWGALSDERTGLPFAIATGPRQRSHFRVRVPYDSWRYFTVSDSRLPFSSPPTTRRATVEVLCQVMAKLNIDRSEN
jgi:hypothetical protein